ncbi:MAG: radical SAM protein [Bacillota bacterium]|nr:radical SAM protein [Bacillota bacterium]
MGTQDLEVMIKHIDIALSINCNLKCKMCGYREPIANEEGLKKEDVFRLLRDARELGLESIAFSGGEVLMRKDIFDIVSYARDLNISEIIVVTNGTLVNEENAKKLVKSGMTNVNISLEGPEHINDFIRGEGTYKKVVEAINIFKKYEEKLVISVNTVISKYNCRNLFEFTKFVYEDLGIRNITYSPLNTDMMGSNLEKYHSDLVALPEDIPYIESAIESIIEFSNSKNDNFISETYMRKMTDYFLGKRIAPQRPCLIPSESCGIDSAGNVFPCWVEYKCAGNITKESLKDIVVKDIYRNQCESALLMKCKGCLVSCYTSVHHDEPGQGAIDDAL